MLKTEDLKTQNIVSCAGSPKCSTDMSIVHKFMGHTSILGEEKQCRINSISIEMDDWY